MAGNHLIRSVEVQGTRRAVELETRSGRALEPVLIDKDIHRLWATGAFYDIRVDAADTPEGTDVIFHVVEKPRLLLHRVLYDPAKGHPEPKVEPGATIDFEGAQRAAVEARAHLIEDGYRDAQVRAELVPAGGRQVDLQLYENAGERYQIQDVRISGDLGLDPAELRNALRATRVTRVVGFLWKSHPPFSEAGLDSDLGRLRSLYISHGYLEPQIRLDGVRYIGDKAAVDLFLRAGPHYEVGNARLIAGGKIVAFTTHAGSFPARDLCTCLFRARRGAERQGKIDFDTALKIRPAEEGGDRVNVDATLETGPAYKVGRISFEGLHRYHDSTVRRALLLDEGSPYDATRLRQSVSRLNRMGLFDPLTDGSLRFVRDPAAHRLDITFQLHEKSRGRWFLSGPVGPTNIMGPFQAVIESRLPRWGSGLLEASTYFVSFNFLAFSSPALRFLPFATSKRFFPVFSVDRPLLPGQWWQSGFLLSPQLDWRGAAAYYGLSHLRGTLRSALGDPNAEPAIAVPVERIQAGAQPASLGFLLCEKPKSRWTLLSGGARFLLDSGLGVVR